MNPFSVSIPMIMLGTAALAHDHGPLPHLHPHGSEIFLTGLAFVTIALAVLYMALRK